MSSVQEEHSDQAAHTDEQQLEEIDEAALGDKDDQVETKQESELWIQQEGKEETREETSENNIEACSVEQEEAAVEVNGEISPWGDNETNQVDEVDTEDDDADAWEWQLRVVQRVSESMLDLTLFTSGGFDFVVMLNVQQNALRDLRPIEGMARTLRVLNASQNDIATLPSIDFWSQFRCLSMCFLSQNALRTWADVQGLEGCSRSLLWLNLTNNPLMALKNARSFIVNKLPFLKALDNFVTTDQEVVQHARPSARFNALSPRLSIAHLLMPLEFETDDAALLYVGETETAVATIHADNSPSVRAQKLIRGYLSRRANFPRFRNVRELIIHVQKHIRGFLLRQLIKRQICELVVANGESKLLMASVAAGHGLLSPLARRSFEKMLPMIRRWRTHFQAKKRAVAIKKIRFWCQMVHQRHARRTRQLLRDQQEIWIYYTPEFEQELLTLATRVARRDPYLMKLSREDRLELLRERCAQSGMSVLRGPNPNSNVVRLASIANTRSPTPERPHRLQREEDEGYKLLRMGRDAQSTLDASSQHPMRRSTAPGWPALIRGFPSDNAVENQLLVAEKRFLQQDLEHIAAIQSQHRQDLANSEVSGAKLPSRMEMVAKRQSRAVLLHLNQVTREIRQRLVICNRKILNACVKQRQRRQQHNSETHFSLTKAKLRARGHAPTRWERKRLVTSSPEYLNGYRKMKVFIPWTIDMYLHIVASLDRAVSMCSWAISQGATREEVEAVLSDSLMWMQDEFPSRWWIHTQRKLEALHTTVKIHGASPPVSKTVKPSPDFHVQQIPPREPETREPVRPSEREPRGPPRVFPRPRQPDSDALVPLHVVDSTLPEDAERHPSDWIKLLVPTQPQTPTPSASPSIPLGSSRHQMLVNRLGKPSYITVEDKQDQEQLAREHYVRDLREEGERATEALIVDRRMLQREKATEVAYIKLDVDVNLQRMRFERELEQIHAREALEHQRYATRRHKQTRKFETCFVAQSGALMRRAARAAVASSLKAEEQEQQRLAAAVKIRDAEALVRRRDSKSFWFVRNRHEKREMEALRLLRSAEADKVERTRLAGRRQRMKEDKEIKKIATHYVSSEFLTGSGGEYSRDLYENTCAYLDHQFLWRLELLLLD
ncbi:hypothetical protein AM588_10005207 [Phytophthora nicotianae]|uniref:Uncharacterized protein n=1 Tax=Phytophthora nicotianae TaxID=4792 RepID=A0A0W8CZY4_PHYNI|nr:hypothetical protein AM588_10005207 [Phytophthora nicotianae]